MSECRKCRDCGLDLIFGENWLQSRANQHRYRCNQCHKDKCRAYYAANGESMRQGFRAYHKANAGTISERQRQYREDNAETLLTYWREYYGSNKEAIRARQNKYQRNNRAGYNARNKARKSLQDQAMLPDSDLAKIAVFYDLAERMTRITGIEYHVDHIIPLSRGGAHHQDNLQVVTKAFNLAKGNRLDFPAIGPGLYANHEKGAE